MDTRSFIGILAVALSLTQAATLRAATLGSQATFSNDFHDVSGTATVLDFDRLRIDDFTFDGGGLDVFFYLGVDDSNASFIGGIPVGDQLVGPPFDGTQEPMIIDLPAGHSLADYGAISVWCVDVSISFGHGTFLPIPEPSAVGLALVVLAAVAATRRRSVR